MSYYLFILYHHQKDVSYDGIAQLWGVGINKYMNDNNNKDEDEETLKRKKIRRILLLKIDEEFKNISKRHSDIIFNSKIITELNKKYNLYNILLSEKSKICYNYVKTEEKIVSNIISQINSDRVINRGKKIEKPNKIINNSFKIFK